MIIPIAIHLFRGPRNTSPYGYVAADQVGTIPGGTAAVAATSTWTGLGTTNNFSDAANWSTLPVGGSNLVFAGLTRLTPNNDFIAGTAFGQITFAAAAGAFTVGGNSVAAVSTITNNSSNAQGINLAFSLTNNITINTNTQDILIGGVISGSGSLTKIGASAVRLSTTNTYSGGTQLSAGEIAVSTDNVLGTGVLTTANNTTLSSNGGGNNIFNGNIVLIGTLNLPAVFSGGGDYNFNGVISGSGLINIPADGNGRRIEFHNTNTFTGGITLGVAGQNQRANIVAYQANSFGTGPISWNQNVGEMRFMGSAGYTVQNNITVPSGAVCTINTPAAVTISGTISGAGSVALNNLGAVTVTGNVTFGSSASHLNLATNGTTAVQTLTTSSTTTLNSITVDFTGALNAGTYTVIAGSSIVGSATQGTPPTGRTWTSLMVVSNNLVAVFA